MKSKEKLNNGKLCVDCLSYCCHDLAMLVSRPYNEADLKELLWYVQYDTVDICVRKNRWYILIKGRCVYLDNMNLCLRYTKRPRRCRDHIPPDCENFGLWYDVKLSTPEQLQDYFNRKHKKK